MDLTTVDFKTELLNAAEGYCKRNGVTLGALGKRMVNDRKFFVRLKETEGSCTLSTFQFLIRKLSVNSNIGTFEKRVKRIGRVLTEN
jgi:hypothetical protein